MSDILQDPGVPFAIILIGTIAAAWVANLALDVYEKHFKK